MIIWNEFCTLVTSVIIRVISPPVEYSSILENAKILNVSEFGFAQVFREARRGDGRVFSGFGAGPQRQKRAQQHESAVHPHFVHVVLVDALVDQQRHKIRNQDVEDDFEGDEDQAS